jgi:hypothetical protein
MSLICHDCGADSGTVGVIENEQLCATCMDREGVRFYHHPETVRTDLPDRNFGVGVPGLIAEECYALRDMLHEKNRKYGNSALEPLRIFSKADPVEAILVRLDDKISRLARGSAAGEDTELDLLGYLILLRVARRLKSEAP